MAATPAQSHLPFSLVDDLTRGSEERFPATDLASELLRLAAQDVSLFQRNSQIAYRAISTARDVRNKINELISNVNTTGDWAAWLKFSAAIDPFEQCLYKIIDVTNDEASQYLPRLNSVDECLTDVTKWQKNRKDLREALADIFSQAELKDLGAVADVPAERDIAGKHDDASLLSALYLQFSNLVKQKIASKGEKAKVFNAMVTRFDNVRTKLRTAPYNSDFFELGVRSSMLVYGALGIGTNNSVKDDWKGHLMSQKVWKSAQSLLGEIITVIDSGDLTLPNVQAKYTAFETLLKALPGASLPSNYDELSKQGGKIRRPYRERAYAYMAICRVLATKFNASAEDVRESRTPLDDAINETLVALKAAAEAVTETQTFDVANIEAGDVSKAFVAAETKIAECFDKFQMGKEWVAEKQKLTAAIESDKERVTQMNKYLTSKYQKAVPKIEAVSVKVTTCKHSGAQAVNGQDGHSKCIHGTGLVLRTTTHTITSMDRLSALLWKECQDLPSDAAQLNGNSTFEKAKGHPLASDCLISSLVENGSASVYLVLTE